MTTMALPAIPAPPDGAFFDSTTVFSTTLYVSDVFFVSDSMDSDAFSVISVDVMGPTLSDVSDPVLARLWEYPGDDIFDTV